MKKSLLMAFLMAFLMSIVPQSAYSEDSNAKYQIHTTSATKEIVVRGGASRLFQFSEGMALVKHRNGWFVINKQGDKLFDLPDGYHPVGELYERSKFYNGRLMICKSIDYSGADVKIIDKSGKVVKELGKTTEVYAPVDGVGRIAVRNGFKTEMFYINLNGEKVGLQTPNSEVYNLVEGVRCYEDPNTHLWGFVDANMNIVVPAKFKDLGAMHNGLAQARNTDGLWGFVNKSGAWVVQPQFSRIPGAFKGPYARVYDKQGVTYFMDKSGKFAWNNSTQRDTKCMEYVPEGYCVWIMYNDSVAPAYAPIHIMDSSFKKVGVIDPMKQKLYFGGDIVASNAQRFQLKDSGDNRLFDWKGNLLLEFYSDGIFSEGLCSASLDDGGGEFYFNDKGEIIVQFVDTKF